MKQQQAVSAAAASKGVKKERHRSPNYPAVGLKEAVERVRQLYAADGKAGAPAAIAAKHIGFGSAHGAAMSVLAALRRFGLVAEANGRIVPTQRAMEILNLPANDPRRTAALQEAALLPVIYRSLVESYQQTGLPSDEVLEAELTTYKGFNPKAVSGFVKDFRDTLDFAGINVSDALESAHTDYEGGESEMPNVHEEPAKLKAMSPPPAGIVRTDEGFKVKVGPGQRPNPSTFIWPLSKDVTAQVTFSGGDVRAAHLDMLAKYLDLAKGALEAEEESQ